MATRTRDNPAATGTYWKTCSQVAARLNVGRETVRLWITRGVRVPGGVVKLRSVWVGARHMTRMRWVREFLQAITDARQAKQEPEFAPSPMPELREWEAPDARKARFQREKEQCRKRLAGDTR